MAGLDVDSRLAACSPTGHCWSGKMKCTLLFLFCREFLIYYYLFFLILPHSIFLPPPTNPHFQLMILVS